MFGWFKKNKPIKEEYKEVIEETEEVECNEEQEQEDEDEDEDEEQDVTEAENQTGCECMYPDWEIYEAFNIRIGERTIGKTYVLRCEECGNMKNHKVSFE